MTAYDPTSDLQLFASEAFDWYRYDEALPCERDHQVARAVEAFIQAPREQIESLSAAVDVYSGYALVSFAERAASWALATNDATHLRNGIVAVTWQWQGCEDPCDGIAVMGALYDAAVRLGASPQDIFGFAAGLTPGPHKAAFTEFLGRPDIGEIAQVMGYSLGRVAGGLRYLRSW